MTGKMETKTLNLQGLGTVYNILRITFVIVPIVAGLDKFANILTDWEKYLNPSLATLLPFSAEVFMRIVGVIEVVAGLLVLLRPSVGGLIVAAWLAAIAMTLIAGGIYLDVAVRDLVMAISAFSMSKFAHIVHE
jgi:uncharacterized membrane protein YphA (DoxX/SURF4 family)